MPLFHRFLVRWLVIIALVNIGGLWLVNYIHYRRYQQLQLMLGQLQTEAPISAVANTTLLVTTDGLSSVSAQLDQIETRVDTLEENQVSGPAVVSPPATTQTTIKEEVIFLGSGASFDTNWVDIPGAALTFSPLEYPHLQSVKFEAALSIIGGEAHARLINKTTGSILASSEVSHNTSQPMWKVSSAFTLPSQSGEYVVQLRSTSGEKAELTGARLRMILK